MNPKGLEILFGAVNPDADLPGFIATYNPPFPVGLAGGLNALEYMQWPKDQRPLVPMMAIVDKWGTIRAQFTAADDGFFDDNLDKHLRPEVEKLLLEKTPPPSKGKAPVKKLSKKTSK